jgi:hypothetical protein
VGKGDGDFYRKVLSAPETLNPYGTKQVPPKVEEVDGKWSVTEGGRTIEAYSLENPHATGYIIPYIPDAKFGFVTHLLQFAWVDVAQVIDFARCGETFSRKCSATYCVDFS